MSCQHVFGTGENFYGERCLTCLVPRDAVDERSPPQWTTEPPTEPGWYWARFSSERLGFPVWAVRVMYSPFGINDLWVEVHGSELHTRLDSFTHFMRLEAPPEPPK